MAGRIWKREQHIRRKLLRRRRQHLHPYIGYGPVQAYRERWPRLVWDELGTFERRIDAEHLASQHPGASVLPTYRFKRQNRTLAERLLGYRVGYQTRVGADFREPVMTWELQEQVQAHRWSVARKWLGKGSLNGGIAKWSRRDHRRWRRAGRYACRLALTGDLDGAENVDLQPGRLGIMWWVW